jgi:hypothetical protein
MRCRVKMKKEDGFNRQTTQVYFLVRNVFGGWGLVSNFPELAVSVEQGHPCHQMARKVPPYLRYFSLLFASDTLYSIDFQILISMKDRSLLVFGNDLPYPIY